MGSLPTSLRQNCEELLEVSISSVEQVSGGDINRASLLRCSRGNYFLKYNSAPRAAEMFRTEANGLRALADPGLIKIPKIVGRGKAGEGYAFLILEHIEQGHPSPSFWRDFGSSLARLHQCTAESFGFLEDNFIGSLPQSNGRHDDFIDFYMAERIEPQLSLAIDSGKMPVDVKNSFDQLYQKLSDIIPDEKAALIHGDLWSGNFLADIHSRPVLIDPSVCYAHREMDLGMSRLFGGFHAQFYQSYHAEYPLEKGWENRIDIFQLYYLLVHVNLFGGGYTNSVNRILAKYS
ncbi:MAG: fructosamine kinase family protein [Saprospiraceae bacterium]|nr:fructosamine kinase family protein [Saprospiraceae bacterium]